MTNVKHSRSFVSYIVLFSGRTKSSTANEMKKYSREVTSLIPDVKGDSIWVLRIVLNLQNSPRLDLGNHKD
jgi:hypothetical protein